jgi:hypothetical protein
MAKTFSCWVIVAGNTPTAFRARERETLLPTLRQLQRTQPDTTLQWFERNRLWASPVEAREALRAKRQFRPARDPAWRPGGDHRDPRARFQLSRDEKRARFKKRQFGARPERPPQGRVSSGRPPQDRTPGGRAPQGRPPGGRGPHSGPPRGRPRGPRRPK